jgi:hypothetical protein
MPYHFKINHALSKVCPPVTSEAGARRPRSFSNF